MGKTDDVVLSWNKWSTVSVISGIVLALSLFVGMKSSPVKIPYHYFISAFVIGIIITSLIQSNGIKNYATGWNQISVVIGVLSIFFVLLFYLAFLLIPVAEANKSARDLIVWSPDSYRIEKYREKPNEFPISMDDFKEAADKGMFRDQTIDYWTGSGDLYHLHRIQVVYTAKLKSGTALDKLRVIKSSSVIPARWIPTTVSQEVEVRMIRKGILRVTYYKEAKHRSLALPLIRY